MAFTKFILEASQFFLDVFYQTCQDLEYNFVRFYLYTCLYKHIHVYTYTANIGISGSIKSIMEHVKEDQINTYLQPKLFVYYGNS
jgi:hypothetical protein